VLGGPKLSNFKIGDQNGKKLKIGGPKLQLSLQKIKNKYKSANCHCILNFNFSLFGPIQSNILSPLDIDSHSLIKSHKPQIKSHNPQPKKKISHILTTIEKLKKNSNIICNFVVILIYILINICDYLEYLNNIFSS
jgi:hypothetical protein